jgi:hypothetical protein
MAMTLFATIGLISSLAIVFTPIVLATKYENFKHSFAKYIWLSLLVLFILMNNDIRHDAYIIFCYVMVGIYLMSWVSLYLCVPLLSLFVPYKLFLFMYNMFKQDNPYVNHKHNKAFKILFAIILSSSSFIVLFNSASKIVQQ